MGPGARWTLAAAVSALAHGGLVAVLALSIRPDPVPQQSPAAARLDLRTEEVTRTQATPAETRGEDAAERAAEGAEVSGATVPVARAPTAALPSQTLASSAALPSQALALAAPSVPALPQVPAEGADVLPVPSAAEVAPPVPPEAAPVAAESPGTEAVEALGVPASAARPVETPSVTAGPVAAEATQSLTPTRPPAQALAARPAAAQLLAAAAAPPVTIRPATATGAAVTPAAFPVSAPLRAAPPPAEPAPSTEPAAPPAVARDPEAIAPQGVPPDDLATAPPATIPAGERATAATAWSGGAGAEVDEVSLDAIQAFMRPGDIVADAGTDALRDGIAALLASVPCARLQTTFLPETGQLELKGHIPEDDLRGPVLAALQAQVGGAIPVADNLLILPRPQCGALSEIANVGLPQSTDQASDPRVVGEDTHARIYDFAEGQRLRFDLQGPDYEAVFYVDYYDADGMVLHLQPNQILGLERVAPAEELVIGGPRDGAPSLEITVAPPFGQEIMVAMAASHPLYDGLRPIREPAEAYIAFLKERIADARDRHPEFKGEWVYFFVRTGPA